VIEKWSEPRTCAAAKRIEKGQDGLFQQTVSAESGIVEVPAEFNPGTGYLLQGKVDNIFVMVDNITH